jgi:hypothetical protein
MRRPGLLRAIVLTSAVGVMSACALSLRHPSIADLRDHPGRYQDRSISVDGTVSSAWGVPLLPFRFYKVDDGTGEVTVLSQGGHLPVRGEHVRVKGRVSEVAVLGGEPIGLHLLQEDLYIHR